MPARAPRRTAGSLALAAAALLATAASPAAGQPQPGFGPYLLEDLNTAPVETPFDAIPGSLPEDSFPLGQLAVFTATDEHHGAELWASDGTAAGTRLVEDICPGPCNSSPRIVATGGGRVFFLAFRAGPAFREIEVQLWATDGTTAGTVQLTAGINVNDTFNSRPRWIDSLGLLLFWANDGVHGFEPWASDATRAGTRLLADLVPGAESSEPFAFADSGHGALFSAEDPAHGRELWRTDGTAAGTALVADIAPGPEGSFPFDFRLLGDTVLFTAETPALGRGLWRTDGTGSGTRLLADLQPGPARAGVWNTARAGGRIVFLLDDGEHGQELWASDGTTAGTRALTAFAPPFPVTTSSGPVPPLFQWGERVVFGSDDGEHGRELWVSDGTPAGTRLLADVCPGACSAFESFAPPVRVVDGVLYFQADDGAHGRELWTSDGTAAGTRLLFDGCPGACSGFAFGFAVVGGGLIVSASQEGVPQLWSVDPATGGGVLLAELEPLPGTIGGFSPVVVGGRMLFAGSDSEHGIELWATDGTPAGTGLFKDIAGTGNAGSMPQELTAAGRRLFFLAYDGAGWELRASDGGATRLVRELPGENELAPPFTGLTAWGDKAVFVADDPSAPGAGLWVSDGSPAGTREVLHVTGGLQPAVGVGRSFFFFSGGLWKTDGTSRGTARVSPAAPGGFGAEGLFAPFVGQLFFSGGKPGDATGTELWRSDGTAAGTVLVKDIAPGAPSSHPSLLTPTGSLLFFRVEEGGAAGGELWKSDGTAAGTALVADVAPGPASSQPQELTLFRGRLFFAADASGTGRGHELWATDGTARGTMPVKDIFPGAAGSTPRELTVVGNLLFFTADDGVHGRELWVSDGTRRGTRLVADLYAGLGSSFPRGLAAASGRLLFAATDGDRGLELWQSDGTAAGTILVADLAPGPASASPEQITPAGERVFLVADDNRHGAEPWALCSTPRPSVSLTNGRAAEGDSGSAPLSFRVSLSNPFCAEVKVNYATQPGTAAAGADFERTNGTLAFPAGTTVRSVPVQVLGDRLEEGDETLFLRLARPDNATIARRRARGLIVDDDRP